MSPPPARYRDRWRSLPWEYWYENHFDLYVAASCIEDRMWLIEQMEDLDIGLPVLEDPQYRLSLHWLHELVARWT